MAIESTAPPTANPKVDEWTSMRGLNRQRTTSIGRDVGKVQEWASMRNLGKFVRRKSGLALGRSNNQIDWSDTDNTNSTSTNSLNVPNAFESDKRIRELEQELSELKRAAEEKIVDLELKVANRDEVLRRRAVTMRERDEKTEALQVKVIELANLNKVLTKELADKEELVHILEDEKKMRPIKGVVRTLALAGTGAMVALASCGGR